MMTKIKKILIILSVILVIVLLFVLVFLSRSTGQIFRPTVPLTPTPSIDTTVPPIIPDPLQNKNQTLTINWNDVEIPESTSLPIYSTNTSLVDTGTISLLPGLLGFTSDDTQESYDPESFLWQKGNGFLYISPPEKTVTYQNGKVPSFSEKKPSLDQVADTALQTAKRFFPNSGSTFEISSLPIPLIIGDYLTDNATPVPLASAEVFQVNITQRLNDLPVIVETGNGMPIQMFLYPSLDLLGLNVKGGFKNANALRNITTLSPDAIRESAPEQIKMISGSGTIGETNLILGANKANLKVETVKLAYYETENDLFVPYLLITGVISSGSTSQQGIFFVPAFRTTTPEP